MDQLFERLRSALADRYALEREIGAGGMATVFLAQDLRHRRPVALKVVRPDLGGPLALDRFLREIELAARLQHPHILPVFDSGLAELGGPSVPWFVMPFVEGETLRHRLRREGALPAEQAVELAREVADALAYAHGHGVVHRDIKPENILLSGGHAVVADFGVAKAIESGTAATTPPHGAQLTAVGIAIGTPTYMSPEQATGHDEVDARADQYSLGCVLYEMLAGTPPFTGGSAQSVIAHAMTAPRPRPSRARAGVPPGVDAVVARAMAADPAERYPDMGALAAALRAAAVGGRPARTGMLIGGVAAVAAVAGVVAWLATRPPEAVVSKPAETIAVLPFNASGAGTEVLGEGMVDLLATNLEGVGGIRTVEPRLVLKRWGDDAAAGGIDRALAVGRELEAGSVVTGSAVSTGGRVRLAADLYAVAGGERLGRAQVDGPVDSVLVLVDRLSIALLRDVWRSREPLPNLSIASLTTDSIAALRAFLEGERHYRGLALDSALEAYTRAVEVDSTFALAHLRRALVFGWTGGYGSKASHEAAAAGFRFGARLPARNRRLLEGYRLFDRGSQLAIDSLAAYVAAYPDDTEGWFTYGEALFHLRDIAPRDPDSIMAAFDKVIAADSTLTPAVIHPLELALVHRDSAKFQAYLAIFERSATPEHINAHRVAAGLAWGPPPSDSALQAALRTVPYPVFYAASSAFRDERASSDTVLHRFEQIGGALPQNIAFNRGQIVRGFALVGLGRLRESRALVDSVARFAPGAAVALLGYPILLGLADRASAGARLDSLLGRDLAQVGSPRRTAYTEVVKLMITGRPAEARSRALRSVTLPDTTADSAQNRGLLRAAGGWAGLAQGDSAAGIADLRSGITEANSPNSGEVTSFLRFQLALALASRAETREDGINRLRYGFESSALYLLPLADLALGRTYEEAGKPDSAALAYGRFLRMWDKADPELQGRLTEAREALTRLAAEVRE